LNTLYIASDTPFIVAPQTIVEKGPES